MNKPTYTTKDPIPTSKYKTQHTTQLVHQLVHSIVTHDFVSQWQTGLNPWVWLISYLRISKLKIYFNRNSSPQITRPKSKVCEFKSKQATKCDNSSTLATNVVNNSLNVSVDTLHPSSTSTKCRKAKKEDKNSFNAVKK